jgi:F-type H+-transporting ATPase subunit c
MVRKGQWLFALAVAGLWLMNGSFAHAQEAAQAAGEIAAGVKMNCALASGLGIAIAALGGALGQGKSIAAALEGMARNPEAAGKIQTAMIIGLALIESLVIYTLVIAIMLFTKI